MNCIVVVLRKLGGLFGEVVKNNKTRKIHQVKWDRFCLPKKETMVSILTFHKLGTSCKIVIEV